jgi:hypothetical protein
LKPTEIETTLFPDFNEAIKLNIKEVPVHTIKVYRGSKGRVPLILTTGTRWR